jgi:hypothetical protein
MYKSCFVVHYAVGIVNVLGIRQNTQIRVSYIKVCIARLRDWWFVWADNNMITIMKHVLTSQKLKEK